MLTSRLMAVASPGAVAARRSPTPDIPGGRDRGGRCAPHEFVGALYPRAAVSPQVPPPCDSGIYRLLELNMLCVIRLLELNMLCVIRLLELNMLCVIRLLELNMPCDSGYRRPNGRRCAQPPGEGRLFLLSVVGLFCRDLTVAVLTRLVRQKSPAPS